MSWNNSDEKLLKELQERRQAYYNTMYECVERFISGIDLESSYEEGLIIEYLIEHATAARKILEPFDSEFTK